MTTLNCTISFTPLRLRVLGRCFANDTLQLLGSFLRIWVVGFCDWLHLGKMRDVGGIVALRAMRAPGEEGVPPDRHEIHKEDAMRRRHE